jgi:protein gp37
MADVFEKRSDLDSPRARLWKLIEATPSLDWLLLTKRPEHVSAMVPWGREWPSNIWLGTTIENQRWAEKRAPELVKHPAAVRFVSCEPMLGAVDLSHWLQKMPGVHSIDWVIAGGESGHHSRPMDPQWTRGLRDQCARFETPFHFKQWGNWSPDVASVQTKRAVRRLTATDGVPVHVINVGKKAAGRILDGREWNDVPLLRRL